MAQTPRTTPDITVSVADAKRRFSELLGRVSFGGETVTITKRGQPVAKLVRVEPAWSWENVRDIKPIEGCDEIFDEIDRIVANRGKDWGHREIPFTGPEFQTVKRKPKRKRKR